MFDKYRVSWRDKGANCSPGNVNVPCPLCGSDPSHHLAISEGGQGYYCFRNPRHAGKNLGKIFKLLKIPYAEWKDAVSGPQEIVEHVKKIHDYTMFSYFEPADTSDEALSYLASRRFSNPKLACRLFNLKVQRTGKWAGRLIIPLTVGWTGRSMRSNILPRYLAETDESGFFLYRSNNSASVIVLEGALDGMRILSVSTQFDIIAKCGNNISASLLLTLINNQYLSIYNLPDSDVPFNQYLEDSKQLATYCARSGVVKIDVPKPVKDIAELTEGDTRKWLSENLSSKTGQGLGGLGLQTIAGKTNGA